MLKNKTVIAILVFVALLGVVVFLQEGVYEKPKDLRLPVLPVIDPKTVDKVEIIAGGESLSFERRGEDWWIVRPKEFPAEKGFESLVVEKLGKLALDRLVVGDKSKHKQFDVTDEEGPLVKAYSNGTELVSLIVGKNTPDFRGTFVRLPGAEAVYATKEVIAGAMKRKLMEWRDKRIFGPFDAAQIQTMNVHLPDDAFGFERTEAVPGDEAGGAPSKTSVSWKALFTPPFAVDKARGDSLATTLAGLEWADILDQTPVSMEEYGLAGETTTWIEIGSKEGGTPKKLIFGREDEPKKGRWLRVEGDPKVYLIRKFTADKLLKDRAYYRGDPPEGANAPKEKGPKEEKEKKEGKEKDKKDPKGPPPPPPKIPVPGKTP